MKKFMVGFIFILITSSAFADCKVSGQFKISGVWTSFNHWYVTLHEGKLIESYTDDLASADWPTKIDIQFEEYIKLSQTTYASDAIIDTVLHLKVVSCTENNMRLIPMYAYEAYLDITDDSEPASIYNTKNLSIQDLELIGIEK